MSEYVIKCESLNNPPVSEFSDISDDDTWNIWLDNMRENQWYSFELSDNQLVYIKLQDNHLIQTMDEPKEKLDV